MTLVEATPGPAAAPGPAFAHASEAEMGRILDFYDVRWEYEPRTFPILWNQAGDVVESFSPDFYLPDLDLFLEMTTLRQRLVRKKNRKIRRLRELYPDLRIKLFYARDFRAMLLKYGRFALAESLSGLSGQVMPDRGSPAAAPAAEVASEDDAVGAVGADPAGADRADALPSGLGLIASERRRKRRRGRRRTAEPEVSTIEAAVDEEG